MASIDVSEAVTSEPQAGSACAPGEADPVARFRPPWGQKLAADLVSFAARSALFLILVSVAGVCHSGGVASRVGGGAARKRGRRSQHRAGAGGRRLLLTGTFYNRGWFRSHILPLARCPALAEIIVIADAPLEPIDKVIYRCPPRRLVRGLGRSLGRLLWILWVSRTERPDVLMGYHIMPNALICLVAARLFGGQAVYQMTGGPIQLIGGGVGSENILLRNLRKPSRILEALAFHVVRQFDRVVVRGRRARQFVIRNKLNQRCSVITGSVDVTRFRPDSKPLDYDIVYVSRLVPRKGLEDCLKILEAVVRQRPSVRVAIVGDGPLRGRLEADAAALRIDTHIDFLGAMDRVEAILQRSRVFLLVSPSEGLSIAMMEAMAVGAVAVVRDVGDLRDMVSPGCTGMLLDSPEPARAAASVLRILEDQPKWARMSEASREVAVQRCSIEAIAQRWSAVLADGD